MQPNCTYIIPPGKDMAVMNGRLHLTDPVAPRGLRLPIDYFFRSLAQDQHERAVCIVLSGTGADGTLGLKEIKGQGGATMVQEPASAAYDGMPRSAIATGMVDYILPPEQMPERLISYMNHALGKPAPAAPVPPPALAAHALEKIFVLLRNQTGHDFTHYKRNTIHRRIERRMAVNQIDQLKGYVRYLQQNPLETDTLFRDLLIGVTSFFRDPEGFESLRQQAIVPLLAGHDRARPLRIWVPGCSTGEEAYSIAVLVQESLEALRKPAKTQIFATDIDAEAIDKARTGIYPNSISADVSAERLARFFRQDNGAYHIVKSIRDRVVFATQNVIDDPPFSRIDLISCRNLMIYLGPELQRKAVALFHYALNPDGFLFLGSSETVGEFTHLFGAVDRNWRLFQRLAGVSPRPVMVPALPSLPDARAIYSSHGHATKDRTTSVRELAERILLVQHAPPCAIIDEQGQVLYIHGHTGRYLEPAPGEASLNIIRMAREGLKLELTAAIRTVVRQKTPLRLPGLWVKTDGDVATVDVLVTPLTRPASMRDFIMVVFHDVTPDPEVEAASAVVEASPVPLAGQDQRTVESERELRTQEEYLQAAIEELETANEELTSTSEEWQSANEELQSTNEELETSKEELQSVNEELTTVNTELQMKMEDLTRTNNDMSNLMAGTGVGTVFVDSHLNIRSFTPAATEVINLIPTDIGRPVGHVVSNLKHRGLVADAQAVLDDLQPREVEVQATDGGWYLMRILPYRTLENVIDGAVITFAGITAQKDMQERLQWLAGESRLAAVVRDSNDAITVQDFEGSILAWNPGAERMYGWSEGQALAMNICGTIPKGKRAEMLAFVRKVAAGESVTPFETQRVKKDGTILDVSLTASQLVNSAGEPYAIATTERVVGGNQTPGSQALAGSSGEER